MTVRVQVSPRPPILEVNMSKKRSGFVSNSSSCSFVIHKSHLDDEKIKIFRKYIEDLKEKDSDEFITECRNYFYGDGNDLYNSDTFYDLLDSLKLERNIDYVMIDG